jgi:hypothetical protein
MSFCAAADPITANMVTSTAENCRAILPFSHTDGLKGTRMCGRSELWTPKRIILLSLPSVLVGEDPLMKIPSSAKQ